MPYGLIAPYLCAKYKKIEYLIFLRKPNSVFSTKFLWPLTYNTLRQTINQKGIICFTPPTWHVKMWGNVMLEFSPFSSLHRFFSILKDLCISPTKLPFILLVPPIRLEIIISSCREGSICLYQLETYIRRTYLMH